MAFGLTVKVAQTKIVSRGIVTPSFLDNWFNFETLIGFDVWMTKKLDCCYVVVNVSADIYDGSIHRLTSF